MAHGEEEGQGSQGGEISLGALPLVQQLQRSQARRVARFHTPGHQGGQGSGLPLKTAWGEAVWQWDLPELPELGSLLDPDGVMAEAQALAAQTFGADRTWFLANGSTLGVMAAIVATCAPGSKLVLPRSVHRSAIAGLIVSGAVPIFVNPPYDADWDLPGTLTPQAVAAALAEHPDVAAVLLVSPTYQGVVAEVAAIAALTQARGIPLLVDEAHGAHFGFHPQLPPRALSQGADLAVQSTHKTLSALTQAAMVHIRGTRVDPQSLTRAVALVQSTSPSYLLLASLDAARHQLATQGQDLMAQTLALAQIACDRIGQIPGLRVWAPSPPRSGFRQGDPTRLTVDVSGLGWSGFAADEWLDRSQGVICELPSLRHLTFMVTLGHTADDIASLVRGLEHLSRQHPSPSQGGSFALENLALENLALENLALENLALENLALGSPSPLAPLTPRQAFFAPGETVPWQQGLHRLSAELICPYPPGIPLVLPGEPITAMAWEQLQRVQAAGGVITGCADPSLMTVRVVRDSGVQS